MLTVHQRECAHEILKKHFFLIEKENRNDPYEFTACQQVS